MHAPIAIASCNVKVISYKSLLWKRLNLKHVTKTMVKLIAIAICTKSSCSTSVMNSQLHIRTCLNYHSINKVEKPRLPWPCTVINRNRYH